MLLPIKGCRVLSGRGSRSWASRIGKWGFIRKSRCLRRECLGCIRHSRYLRLGLLGRIRNAWRIRALGSVNLYGDGRSMEESLIAFMGCLQEGELQSWVFSSFSLRISVTDAHIVNTRRSTRRHGVWKVFDSVTSKFHQVRADGEVQARGRRYEIHGQTVDVRL